MPDVPAGSGRPGRTDQPPTCISGDAVTDTRAEIDVVPSLSMVRPSCTTASEVLAAVAAAAVEQGFAGPGFEAALLAREAQYPTGLPTPLPAAIPHTDPEHVLRPGMAAVLLDPPVDFGEMGGSGASVAVRLVVVLLVDDPATQVRLLSQLVAVLRRPDLADRVAGCATGDELALTLRGLLGDG